MKQSPERIFLTGGSGFLGKHMQPFFQDRYAVLSPTRSSLELTNAALVEKYVSQHAPIDYVLHAANAGSGRNATKPPQDCLFENLMAFRNIFESTSTAKRLINFSSGAEYAKPFSKPFMSEQDAGLHLPKEVYGLAKFFIGDFLEKLQPGRFVNLRIFAVFGPFEDYRIRFISHAIVRTFLGLPIVLNQNSVFDYIYVNDFLKILHYFMENSAPDVNYNIATGTPITLVELAKKVHQLTKNKYELIVKDHSIKEHYTADNTRLKNFLPNDFTFTPIEIAIEELIQWYDRYLSGLNESALNAIKDEV